MSLLYVYMTWNRLSNCWLICPYIHSEHSLSQSRSLALPLFVSIQWARMIKNNAKSWMHEMLNLMTYFDLKLYIPKNCLVEQIFSLLSYCVKCRLFILLLHFIYGNDQQKTIHPWKCSFGKQFILRIMCRVEFIQRDTSK